MRKLIALVGVLVLCASALADDVRLIEPGEFHGSDVEAIHTKNDELWLGFYPRGNEFIWHSVVLKVEVTRDEMVDEEGQATGRTFTAMSGTAVPLFLVSGLDKLAANKVTTVKTEASLSNGSVETVTLNDVQYRLEVMNPKTKDKTITQGSVISLVSGNTRQELFAVPDGADEPDWRLIWAGDLDGDGKLDLYMDLSNHYNVSHKRLFLSSQAEAGKLVKQAAEFVTTGC